VKNLKISPKLIALFVLGAIGSIFYVTRSRAFTLIELQLVPATYLVASQSAEITVSNVTGNNLDVTITVFRESGMVMSTKTVTLAPMATATHTVQAAAGGPLTFRAAIELGTANSAISDVMTFDRTTGQVIAILPGALLPAVQ